MQIVIEIPEKMYHMINAGFYDYGDMNVIIQNGTLLPKGHGRLIDADKIEWYGCTTAFDCPHKDRECKDCDRAECSKTQVDDIPTIIEAGKAESEDKCKNCKYYRNPDYTRCHECESEREDKE